MTTTTTAPETSAADPGETAPEAAVTAAAGAVETDAPPAEDADGVVYRRWRSPVCVVEGVWSGDDRMIEAGALTWRDLPLPLMAQTETASGHDGAQLVGRIDAISRADASGMADSRTGQPYGAGAQVVMAEGVFDNDETARMVAGKIGGGFLRGVSVDLSDVDYVDELVDADGNVVDVDDADDEDWESLRLRSRVTAGRIMGLCYDDQTEILTELRGWQSFADLDGDDRVATRNQKTGEFEWAAPTYHHHDRWTGRMIRFIGRNLDLLVTPNHRMYVVPATGGPPEILTAEDLLACGATAYRVPLTSEWTVPDVSMIRIEREPRLEGVCACGCNASVGTRGGAARRCSLGECDRPAHAKGWCNSHYHRFLRHGDPTAGGPLCRVRPNVKLTRQRITLPGHGHGLTAEPLMFRGDDFAAFMGAYLAEGSCGGTKAVTVSQMPTSKGFAMYEALFSRMFRSHYHDGNGFRVASSRLRDYLRQFGLAGDKFVPDLVKNMSARQLRIFLDHYLAGDGTYDVRGNHTRWRAVTVSRRLAEDIQEIAQKVGLSASVRVRVAKADTRIGDRVIRKENIRPIYSVVGRTSRLAPIWRAEAVDDYDGDVRCVSVPNEILYVRRNGYPVWCGNTITPFPAFEGACIECLDDEGAAGPAMEPGSPTREQQAASLRTTSEFRSRECAPCESGALTAAAAPVEPPAAWFDDPRLPGPTPLTVTDDGRVFGHLARWDVCHTGISGQCVTAPRSATGYAWFRTGAVKVAEGTLVPTGRLTVGTGHASTTRGFSRTAAMAHYDDTGTAVADVAAGEDEYGIWLAGALRPDATPEQVRVLRGSPLSGDWRDAGTGLELIAALAVNTPGYPVLRQVVASGRPVALVASSLPPRPEPDGIAEVRALLPELYGIVERDRAARAAGARGRMAALDRSARAGALRARMGVGG